MKKLSELIVLAMMFITTSCDIMIFRLNERRKAMKKKIITMLLLVLTIGLLTACGANDENASGGSEGESAMDGDTMVIYFSLTGNTKAVAQTIADMTDATMYEIKPKQAYKEEDLSHDDKNCRSWKEQQNKKARPAFAGDPPSLKGVTTIYLGYPIWHGEEPRVVDTFVEALDLDGITVIPFCTSGSTEIGNTGKNLEKNAGAGTWYPGQRFSEDASEDEVIDWLGSLEE